MPPKTKEPSLICYLTYSWGNKRWIHIFPKVICAPLLKIWSIELLIGLFAVVWLWKPLLFKIIVSVFENNRANVWRIFWMRLNLNHLKCSIICNTWKIVVTLSLFLFNCYKNNSVTSLINFLPYMWKKAVPAILCFSLSISSFLLL